MHSLDMLTEKTPSSQDFAASSHVFGLPNASSGVKPKSVAAPSALEVKTAATSSGVNQHVNATQPAVVAPSSMPGVS